MWRQQILIAFGISAQQKLVAPQACVLRRIWWCNQVFTSLRNFAKQNSECASSIWARRNVKAHLGPLVKRLRHRPFTAVTGVRFSHGSLTWCHSQEVRHGTATPPPPVQIWVAPLKTSHQDDGTFFVVFAAYLRTRIIDQKCKYFATTLPVSVFSQTKMSVKNSP